MKKIFNPASLATAALIIFTAVFMLTGCPNAFGGGGSVENIIIKYDAERISVYMRGANNTWDVIPPNTKVYAGRQLSFNIKNLPAGQQVDKWKVNGTEIPYNGYIVNLSDAVDEGTQKVITVTYTTKGAEAVVVKFDETHINVGLNGTFIPTGHTVYEGGQLSFRARNLPAGKQIDKWRVNTKEFKSRFYTVNVADAVDEGTQKVITVTYTLKADR